MVFVPDVPKDIADRLYTAAPDEFTAARAQAAKAAGDKTLAKAITALRKPTVAAWLINRHALTHPDQLTDLDRLASAFRAAQQGLHGDDLRRLADERKALVADLVAQIRTPATPITALAEIEATLLAAVADEDVAALVRAGRLLKTTSYAGFGPLDLVASEPASDARPKPSPVVDLAAEAEQERQEAQAAVQAAESEMELAAAAQDLAEIRFDQADEALSEARRVQIEAKEELHARRLTHTTAQRALVAAKRRLDRASLS